MRVLVVGGAGYIGSHTVRLLNQSGHQVWVYDNLCMGHRQSVKAEQLIVGELSDRPRLESVLRENRIEGEPRYQRIEEIVQTAWNWHRSHPNGYSGVSQS